MEITETERKILRVKAGAILILGMQMGSELQLDTEEKREDALMQLVAMQRLVEKAGYSPDLAFDYFGYSEQKRQLYKKVPVKGRLLLPLYQKKINTISLGKIIFMKITTIFQLSIKVTGSICLMKRKTIG